MVSKPVKEQRQSDGRQDPLDDTDNDVFILQPGTHQVLQPVDILVREVRSLEQTMRLSIVWCVENLHMERSKALVAF